jgi:hypothetical protein
VLSYASGEECEILNCEKKIRAEIGYSQLYNFITYCQGKLRDSFYAEGPF